MQQGKNTSFPENAFIFKKILQLLLVILLAYIAGRLGLKLATINNNVSPVWPASGVAFLSFLYFGNLSLIPIFIGAFLYNLHAGSPILLAACIAIGNSLEGFLSAFAYRFMRRQWHRIGENPELISILSAIFFGVWISAIVGVYSLIKFQVLKESGAVFESLLTWWIGDALGILILGPVYFIFKKADFKGGPNLLKRISGYLFAILMALICSAILFRYQSGPHIIFLINALLLLFLFLTDSKRSYLAMLTIYAYAIWVLHSKTENFLLRGDDNFNFLNLQLVFTGVSITFILLSKIPTRHLRSYAVLILLASWLASGFLVHYTQYVETKTSRAEIQQTIEKLEYRFHERIEDYTFALAFASTLLASEREVNNDKWAEMSSKLSIEKRYPGILGIGFIYSVPRASVEKWLQAYNQRNNTKIVYKAISGDIEKNPIAPDQSFIITAIEPLTTNFKALGLDTATEQHRYAAALKSIFTQKPAITNRIQIVNKPNFPYGFLFYYPTFDKLTKDFIGWSYAVFSWDDFLNALFNENSKNSNVVYSISLSHFNDEEEIGSSPNYIKDEKIIHLTEIPFADKKIKIAWQLSHAFKNRLPTVAWISAFLSIISILLFSLLNSLLKDQDKIKKLIDKKEDELKESQYQLLQASKLSSLGEMAGGIAHEINNPLAIIRARAGLLRKQLEKEQISKEKILESADVIDKTILRISKIIDGLRTFSRAPAEQEPLLPITLTSVIEETLIFCAERFKNHGVELELDIDPKILILGRETQLTQVFLNLLNNSFDAVQNHENPWIGIRAFPEGNFAIVEFSDSGDGIPEEVAEKMMQPFYTTKEVGKGTGLGLSISSRIITEHGGALQYRAKSKNTTFLVKLPLH